ncbi:MAG: hypothetical protein II453_07990 [Alphaproteobacteria bacterium]|nr:hypothetical protein [Alphaproteobacteria bacterium]
MTDCMTINSGYCGSLCNNSAGGVQRFYIVNTVDIDKTSLTYSADGELTEMSIDGNMYAYIPYVDSSNWVETANVSPENGSVFFEQSANLVLGKTSQSLRNIVERLGKSSNMVVFVLDNNDVLWMIGDPNGKKRTYMSAADGGSGTALGDRNGYSITLTCRNASPAIEVVPANGSDLASSIAAADAVCDGNAS